MSGDEVDPPVQVNPTATTHAAVHPEIGPTAPLSQLSVEVLSPLPQELVTRVHTLGEAVPQS